MNPESGGPCQGIRNTIPAMKEHGVTNEVVCMDSPDSEWLGKDDFEIYALGPAENPWKYSSKLIPFLMENAPKYNAIIAHGMWLFADYAVSHTMRKLKRNAANTQNLPKWYIMPHGMLDPYFQKSPERRLKAIRNTIYWKLIEHKVVASADGLLFTSSEEMKLASQPFRPYRPVKEINVGYGIQEPPAASSALSEAFFADYPELRDRTFILFLSRIHAKKGLDLLIDAYESLCGGYGAADLPWLVIAGPNLDSTFGRACVKKAKENPLLNKRIVFTGMLTGDKKWGAFHTCSAFVLPSHQENFGIAVAEALACSKPVLITDKVNIWREIQEGGAGIVKEDSVEGVRELLDIWLKRNRSEIDHMERSAVEVYRNHFEINQAIKKLMEVVSGTIENGHD